MNASNKLDKRSLLVQLDVYKTVFRVNSDLLEKDQLLREQIFHRIEMLESKINELGMWEKQRNPIEYDNALDEANQIQLGIRTLFDQMFQQDPPVSC